MPEFNSRSRVHYVHRLNYTHRERLVGAFVLLALAIVLALVFAKGRTTHLFEERISFHAYLQNAQGVNEESVVKISGIKVGRVSSIGLSPDNKIHVTFFVYERFRDLIRTDSRAALSKLSIVGDASIEITAGSPLKPVLSEDSTLLIEEPMSIDELLSQLTPVMGKVKETLDGMSRIVAAIDPQTVQTSSEALKESLVNLQAISDQVNRGEGALGSMVRDEQLQKNLVSSMNTLDSTLRKAEQRVVELRPLLQNVNALTEDSRRMSRQLQGLIGESENLVREMGLAVNSINVDLQQVPEMISRMQLLLQSTDATLQGLQQIWPLSSAVEKGRSQQQVIEVRPGNE